MLCNASNSITARAAFRLVLRKRAFFFPFPLSFVAAPDNLAKASNFFKFISLVQPEILIRVEVSERSARRRS